MVTGLAVDWSSDGCSGGGGGVCKPLSTLTGRQGGLLHHWRSGGKLGFNLLRSSFGLRWQLTLRTPVGVPAAFKLQQLTAASTTPGHHTHRPPDRRGACMEYFRTLIQDTMVQSGSGVPCIALITAAACCRQWAPSLAPPSPLPPIHCACTALQAIKSAEGLRSASHAARPVQNRPFINRWRAQAPARPAAAGPAAPPRAAKRPAGKGGRPTAASPRLKVTMSSTGWGRRAAALACAHRVWRASTRRARGAPYMCRTALSNRPFSFVDRSEALAHHPHSSALPALAASPPRRHYHPLPPAAC